MTTNITFNNDTSTVTHRTLKEKTMRFIQHTLTSFFILLVSSIAIAKELSILHQSSTHVEGNASNH
jgi:hypothetical protein